MVLTTLGDQMYLFGGLIVTEDLGSAGDLS